MDTLLVPSVGARTREQEPSKEPDDREPQTAIESEVSRICDLVGANGTIESKYRGHGKEVAIVKRMILPMRSSASLGQLPIRKHALVWLHNRVAELACMCQEYQQGRRIAAATTKQWGHIMKRLSSRKGLVEVVRKISMQWSNNVDAIAAHALG